MKRTIIYPRIVLLEFDTQYNMCSTLARFQEYYESPKFRGKIFDHEKFMDWYANDRGKFSYFEDWAGFNFPSAILQAFYKGQFDPLQRKEQRVLDTLKPMNRKWGMKYYVIACMTSQSYHILKHETAHAFFYVDHDYRKAVLEAVRSYNTEAVKKKLIKTGYHKAVLEDEVHAYVMTEHLDSVMVPKRLFPLRRRLQKLFREVVKSHE